MYLHVLHCFWQRCPSNNCEHALNSKTKQTKNISNNHMASSGACWSLMPSLYSTMSFLIVACLYQHHSWVAYNRCTTRCCTPASFMHRSLPPGCFTRKQLLLYWIITLIIRYVMQKIGFQLLPKRQRLTKMTVETSFAALINHPLASDN